MSSANIFLNIIDIIELGLHQTFCGSNDKQTRLNEAPVFSFQSTQPGKESQSGPTAVSEIEEVL